MKENLKEKLSKEEYSEIKDYILNLRVVPSMRLLWSAGDAAKASNVTAFNCSYIGINKLQDFGDIIYILACGTGLGFTVEEHIINELPQIKKQKGEILPTFIIADSKEGWANATVFGIETWFSGKDVEFDFSKIRPAGTRLKTMGGRSSGPDPLKDCLIYIRNKIFFRQGRRLRSIDVHDIVCKIGETIVSGGVRRTALISLSDLNDNSMKFAKTGTFWQIEPQRQMSNNSTVFNEKPSAEKFLDEWISLVKSGTGERGIFNRSNLLKSQPKRRHKILKENLDDFGTNPCVSGDTLVLTPEGWKEVKDINEGDNIITATGWTFPVTEKQIYKNREIYKVVCTDLNDNEIEIKATNSHIFHSKQPGAFWSDTVRLKDLQPGNKLKHVQHDTISKQFLESEVRIESIAYYGKEDVYDLYEEKTDTWITNGLVSRGCGEIVLKSKSFCNLTEVIARPDDTEETLLNKIRIATILGTYQATLTNFPYISKEWKKNCSEEALLGVSITGFWDCEIVRNPDILNKLRHKAIEINKEYAKKFEINEAMCITTAKPSGNVSQLVDSASGVHTRYSKYYIRRVRINATDPLFKMLKDQKIPYHPEVGQVDGLATTYVLEFPIKSPNGAITRHDLNAIQQLEFWKNVKVNYTEHNPSVTIYVEEHEWIEVANWVYKEWDIIGGLSFLPKDKHIYTLAPYEEITEERYLQLIKEFPEIDCSKILAYEHEDETEGSKEYACSSGSCELR